MPAMYSGPIISNLIRYSAMQPGRGSLFGSAHHMQSDVVMATTDGNDVTMSGSDDVVMGSSDAAIAMDTSDDAGLTNELMDIDNDGGIDICRNIVEGSEKGEPMELDQRADHAIKLVRCPSMSREGPTPMNDTNNNNTDHHDENEPIESKDSTREEDQVTESDVPATPTISDITTPTIDARPVARAPSPPSYPALRADDVKRVLNERLMADAMRVRNRVTPKPRSRVVINLTLDNIEDDLEDERSQSEDEVSLYGVSSVCASHQHADNVAGQQITNKEDKKDQKKKEKMIKKEEKNVEKIKKENEEKLKNANNQKEEKKMKEKTQKVTKIKIDPKEDTQIKEIKKKDEKIKNNENIKKDKNKNNPTELPGIAGPSIKGILKKPKTSFKINKKSKRSKSRNKAEDNNTSGTSKAITNTPVAANYSSSDNTATKDNVTVDKEEKSKRAKTRRRVSQPPVAVPIASTSTAADTKQTKDSKKKNKTPRKHKSLRERSDHDKAQRDEYANQKRLREAGILRLTSSPDVRMPVSKREVLQREVPVLRPHPNHTPVRHESPKKATTVVISAPGGYRIAKPLPPSYKIPRTSKSSPRPMVTPLSRDEYREHVKRNFGKIPQAVGWPAYNAPKPQRPPQSEKLYQNMYRNNMKEIRSFCIVDRGRYTSETRALEMQEALDAVNFPNEPPRIILPPSTFRKDRKNMIREMAYEWNSVRPPKRERDGVDTEKAAEEDEGRGKRRKQQ